MKRSSFLHPENLPEETRADQKKKSRKDDTVAIVSPRMMMMMMMMMRVIGWSNPLQASYSFLVSLASPRRKTLKKKHLKIISLRRNIYNSINKKIFINEQKDKAMIKLKLFCLIYMM